MTTPHVSIIIPCFNAERFIGDAIRNAIEQTYRPIEVIVIDDGSTDGSLEVIRSFGDSIRWETGPNRGGCAARNRGIELARGELIQFLDADDLLHPEKLATQMDVARDSGVAGVLCDGAMINYENGHYITSIVPSLDHGDFVCCAIDTMPLIEAILHKRKALLDIKGFQVGLPASQEFDLHVRLACAGNHYAYTKQTLYTVRKVRDSVSNNYVHAIAQHARILRRAFRQLEASGGMTDARARAFAGRVATDARGCLRRGASTTARRFLALARQMHPQRGIDRAYGRGSRMICNALGPVQTERIAGLVSQLRRRPVP